MAYGTKLIDKLTLDKDLSIDRDVIERGRFRHFWFILRKNSSSIMLMNLLLVIFALPAVFLIFFLMPALEKAAVAMYNFSGELGMGFPGATQDFIPASIAVYNIRMIIVACLVPCISLIGLGMAGAFYCCRNYLWGTKVKIRVHFFRGIKKYWWQYTSAFTYLGAVACSIAISIINHLKMSVAASAPWWSYLIMVSLCIVGLLSFMFMLVFLPMQNTYSYSFRTKIKNSLLLALVLIIPSLLLTVIMSIPVAFAFNSITRIILYMFFVFIGFGMYALGISEYGQFACDSFIRHLYEQKLYTEEKERLRQIKGANRNKNKNTGSRPQTKKKR